MKAYSKVYYLIAFLGVVLPLSVGAATLTFDHNTTLVLPSTGDSYIIDSGSTAESLSVSSGTITISIVGGEHVTLESVDKRQFSNSLSQQWECNTNTSSITFSRDASLSTSQTITVTPSSSCSSSSSGGGGGGGIISSGGGGGGGSSAPTIPTQTTTQTTAPVTPLTAPSVPAASVAQPSVVAGAVSPVFNKDLSVGSKNNDVSRLQKLLAKDKAIYPEGTVSGNFGPLTSAAVKRFQKKYGLPQVGRVGPATRKKLEEVFGGKTSTAPEVKPSVQAPVAPAASASVDQVKALQDQISALQAQIKALPAASPTITPSSGGSSLPSFLQMTPAPKPQ